MKYLLMCCTEEKKFDAMSQSECDALMAETVAYCEALRKSGYLIGAEPLEPVRMSMTVRVRKDRVSVTDGPFAETKEQIGGFFLINARDLNEAIQVASRFPSARLGSLEVRPVKELRGCNWPAPPS
jgi:hypothetical protein